jgi:tetratricopeptide (TPR) repeat protein
MKEDLGQRMNLVQSLAREGSILGDGDKPNLGHGGDAVPVLSRGFQIADEAVHRDPLDQSTRGALQDAGYLLANILRDSDPRGALAIYDHVLRHLSEVRNNASFRRLEVQTLAGSAYALQSVGQSAEARQRLDSAFGRLRELKLYPAEKVASGSVAYKALRAQADFEAVNGNVPRAIEFYQNLLDRTAAAGSEPRSLLEDAVDYSNLHVALAGLHRRNGHADLAEAASARRLELWEQWGRKLPANPFIAQQLASARTATDNREERNTFAKTR